MTSSTCRFCGHTTEFAPINREINKYKLFKCGHCASIGIAEQPTSEEIGRIYDQLFATGAYAQHREEYAEIMNGRAPYNPYRHLLLRYLELKIPGRRMIEIGGGTGAFGNYAKSRGWQYSDFDISNVAVEDVRTIGLDATVFSSSLLPPLPIDESDMVVMWEVIEHVFDVNGYLRKIFDSLKSGGIFLFSTPNYYRKGYQGSDFGVLGSPPVHINFFTKDSLEFLLKNVGFSKLQIYKRRLFSPSPRTIKGLERSVCRLLGLEESPTLIGIAYKG